MLSPGISSSLMGSLNRTLVGTGLKSIGTIARVNDYPKEFSTLRNQALKRELTVMGMIFMTSMTLEGVFALIKPALSEAFKKSAWFQVLQFVPQVAAYIFSEWSSRKIIPFNQSFEAVLKASQNTTGKVNPFKPANLVTIPLNSPSFAAFNPNYGAERFY